MKDAYYFSHDSNARNDLKMVKLRKELGLLGVGLFWCVVEMLREANGYKLPITEISAICYELRIDDNDFQKLFDCGLFVQKNKFFFSESLLQRMERLDGIKVKRAESGRIGGQNRASKSQANAKQMLSKNEATLKQNEASIVKHSIVENSIEKNSKVKDSKILLSQISEADLEEPTLTYFRTALAFQDLFKKIATESGGSITQLNKANITWIDEIRKMIEIDKIEIENIRRVWAWLPKSDFWKKNIQSTATLRKQFNKLIIEVNHERTKSTNAGLSEDRQAELRGIAEGIFAKIDERDRKLSGQQV
jgi:hypothetical protein